MNKEKQQSKRKETKGFATFRYPGKPIINLDFTYNKGVTSDQTQVCEFKNGARVGIQAYSQCSVLGLRMINVLPKADNEEYDTALKQLFSTLNMANNGRINYTIADLSNYLFTTMNLHCVRGIMAKAIKACNMYSAYDASIPNTLMASMGLDIVTFRDNLSDLRDKLYNFDLMIAKNFPIRMPIMDWKRHIYGEVFRETNEGKSPYYTINCWEAACLYKDSNGDVQRQNVTIGAGQTATATGLDYTTFINDINTLINRLDEYHEYPLICNDILKVYGQDAIYVARIEELHPEYSGIVDKMILQQIHNANCFNAIGHDSNGQAYFGTFTDNGSNTPLGWRPDWRVAVTHLAYVKNNADEIDRYRQFLNKPTQLIATDQNSLADDEAISLPIWSFRMNATLSRATDANGGHLQGTFYCQCIMYELCAQMTYWSVSTDSANYGYVAPTSVGGWTFYLMDLADAALDSVLKVRGELEMKTGVFNYHPRFILSEGFRYTTLDINGNNRLGYIEWDFYNTSEVDEKQLTNLHALCSASAMRTTPMRRTYKLEELHFIDR